MSSPTEPPVIAILMPLFGHSVLVVDALLAALGQKSRYPFIIVVINDGCRFVESDEKIKSIVSLHPDRIRYVVQPNAGLSAARNTGIDYALAKFASLQAIYFLDADNSIQPKALDNAYAQLLRHPRASWVYPNIDMFGVRRNFDYGGPYSPLKHTRYNICEAGSLVHRRVFDAGVRFDESMKLGYEDWDFWLGALGHGFTGVHHQNFGFRYRNRAESMLSQSKRDDAQISAYIRKKHRPLLRGRNLVSLEATEAPRYAILFADTNETWLTAGLSGSPQPLANSAFDELLWRNIVIPNWQYIPPVFIFTTRMVYEDLAGAGLLPWALYDCERALAQMNFACITLKRSAGNKYEVQAGGSARQCGVLALGRDLLCSIIKDSDTSWIENIQSAETEMRVGNRLVTLPQGSHSADVAAGSVALAFLLKVISWRTSPYLPAARHNWMWRDVSVRLPHSVGQVVRDAFAGEVVYPAAAPTGRHIGFVVSIGSFGGVERVAYNVARQFSRAGWQVHLFILGCGVLEIPGEFAGVATSVNFIEDALLNGWDPHSEYQGTALPSAGSGPATAVNRIVAALGWLDAVVNCHSGALNAAAASLRQLGVKTATHLHLLDHSPLGRSVGHAMIALAYEHAYDLIICNSEHLASWMHAAGVPQAKLVRVPNAPGHSLDEKIRRTILARRSQAIEKPLNVLYLGRLDRQKGVDRLATVIERTRELQLPVRWRIVGAPITDDYQTPAIVAQFREPAVFESEALIALFSWADVLILLSDYEGVPLSVLEAQRSGVVVIATNVGALAEIIDSGRTGFLVENDTAVEEAVTILGLLSNATGLRSAIATAAAAVIEWPEATAELIRRVTALVAASQPIQPPIAVAGQAGGRYDRVEKSNRDGAQC
jgi:glycosyltransferase involved in cell wall biosynthesis